MSHLRVSLPAAAILSALLGLLAFDFDASLGALPAQILWWGARGLLIAVLTGVVLRLRNHVAVAVAFGAASGAALSLAAHLRDPQAPVWLGIGAGVVVAALVQTLSIIEIRDVVPATLLSLLFFLLIATFWIAKSIKKGLLVAHYKEVPFDLNGYPLSGAGAEQLAKVGNMVVAALAVTVFTWLARRRAGERLVTPLAAFFAIAFLIFAAGLGHPTTPAVWAFYLFGDLFNMVMVTAFFAFLHDSVIPEQARRIYPLIVFGGVLGGVMGSTTVRSLQQSVGERPLLLACTIACVLIGGLALAAAPRLRAAAGIDRGAAPPPASTAVGNAALEGAKLVLHSRYLLAIVALLGLYEFCSATLDYQWTAKQVLDLADAAAIKHHTATVYAVTNWTAMLVQLLFTGALLRRFGVKAALLVLPAAILFSSATFLVVPMLLTAAALSVSDNSLNYSVNQSAREMLWVAAGREEKYRAKAFSDMFVQRAAKAVAVVLALLLDALGPAWARWLALPVIALVVAWIVMARFAASEFERRTHARAAPADAEAA